MVPVPYVGRFPRALTVVGGALLLLSACTGRVDEPAPSAKPALEALGSPAPRVPNAALRVSREELAKRLAPHLSRSGEGLKVERTKHGSMRIDHAGRFQSAHVAVRQPDGSTRIQCVTSKAELDALLATGVE